MRLGLGLGVDSITSQKIGAGFTGILDEYSGAAAAYSVRRLSSTYTGSAMKVRRSSDGGLQDIGFDSNGNLDTTALTTFVNASGNAYASDFTSGNEDMVEVGGTGADGQSIADVSDAYKFTQDSSTGIHRAANPTNTNIVGGNISVSFDYYLPSGQTANRILFRTSDAGDAQVDLTTTDAWTTYTTTFSGIAGDSFLFYSAIIGQGLSFTGNGSDHFYLKNIVVTQTDADGHVTRWYSQSDPDTYTADFSGGVDGFSGTTNNTASALTSVTDDYGTTIDNVLQLNCDNTTSDEHILRKNNPLPTTGSIANLTLKCSFKMLVPSSNTTLVGAALSNGSQSTAGIVSGGKVTEQGRWTTFTDVEWTQVNQSRLFIMGLDSSDNVTFSATEDDKFYIADVVLTEIRDVYNTTDSLQPLIVSGGTLVEENSKAAIDFDGVDDKLGFASNLNIGGSPSIIGVLKSAAGDIVWRAGGSDYWYFQTSQVLRYRNGDFDASWTNSDGLPIITGSQKLIATYKNSTSVELAVDGASKGTKSSGTGADGYFNNIGSDLAGYVIDGVWQELIIFNSDQSGNRTGIETNINDHFNIYTP